jgi:hypothetical protein
LNYKVCAGFEILEKESVTGPLASSTRRPHSHVSQPTHARGQRWRGHRPPPHAGTVGRPPRLLHAPHMRPRRCVPLPALPCSQRSTSVSPPRVPLAASALHRLADATASTVCAPRTSPSHELGATATGRRSPRCSPPVVAHHRGGPHPREFLGPNAPQIRSPRCPLALAPFPRCPHRRRPPESTGAAASLRHGSSSPILPVGCQPEPSRPSCWTVPKQQWVSAHVHSSISHFSQI